MKKVAKGAALALVLVCLAFSMTACAGSGKYVNTTLGVETTYNLKAGYKYEKVVKSGSTTSTEKGKWKKDGNSIIFTPDGDKVIEYTGTLDGKTLIIGIVKYTKK